MVKDEYKKAKRTVQSLVLKTIKESVKQEIQLSTGLGNLPKQMSKVEVEMEGNWIVVRNNWRGDQEHNMGKPLAKYFEEGTDDHEILPIRSPKLMWITTKRHPSHSGKVGERVASYGHWVTGIPASYFIRDGFRRGLQKGIEQVQQILNRMTVDIDELMREGFWDIEQVRGFETDTKVNELKELQDTLKASYKNLTEQPRNEPYRRKEAGRQAIERAYDEGWEGTAS